jgi:hypothetical protein
MVKVKIRIIGVLVILLMLGTSPLSVNAFTENKVNQEGNREILTEKMVDGKLKVNHYALPNDLVEEDLQRILSMDEKMTWGYVNYKSYNAGIVIFDGKVSKLGENQWEVVENEDLSDVKLGFKVVFSGFDVESEENVIVVALMNFMIKNLESAQNIKIQQVGDQATNTENIIGSNQEFRNSIW